jgi:SAM-dependent methyltransferase
VPEPAHWGLRRRVLDLLDRLHLARPAVAGYEVALATSARLRGRDTADDEGVPLPPALLRTQIGPLHADAEFFLRSGRHHADLVRAILSDAGSAIEEIDALLDWGCGCGRVLRHWSRLSKTRVHGCDINPKMVEWCNANLAFANVDQNELSPPFPYGDSTFDLVYAFSVITHLSEQLQHDWVRECLRVLKPEGLLLFSTLGEHYASLDRLNKAELQAFENDEVVVLYDGSPGTSLCSAYHPVRYVRERLAVDFEPAAFRPAGDDGKHDLHLFRKPAAVRTSAAV